MGRAGASAVFFAALLAAGCIAAPETAHDPPTLILDCPTGEAQDANLDCLLWFRDEMEPAFEATLSTQSNDARRVAVAWKQEREADGDVHVAVTSDGGSTWARSSFAVSAGALPASSYAYDPDVIALPNGDVLVLFGGYWVHAEDAGLAGAWKFEWSPVRLARSSDGGATWATSEATASPGGAVTADYWNLAVAPDDGRMYLVANAGIQPSCVWVQDTWQCPFQSLGVWLWTSDDDGISWQGPTVVAPPVDSRKVQPRVVAGARGLVALLSYDLQSAQLVLDVSRDHGQSWESRGIPADVEVAARSLTVAGSDLIVAGYDGANVTLHRSGDRGATWSAEVLLGALPALGRQWAQTAVAPNGDVAVLAEFDVPCAEDVPARWGTTLFVQANAAVQVTPLAGPVPQHVACAAGNDYAGLAFSQDGSLWAAWADPRAGDVPGIAVAHFVPT